MTRGLIVLVAALLLGGTWAQTLRIDDTGGPLTLREELNAAIQAWQGASTTPLDLSLAEDGAVSVRYATDTPLGPDTLSLTLQRPEVDGAPMVEIRLNPDRYRSSPATLLHELGVLLGLQPNDDPDSVMRPAMGSAAPALPSSSDAERLETFRSSIPEDVNRDGAVDFYDLAALAGAFGAQGINLPADIDRNGAVDEADLEALRNAYVFGEPSPTPPTATAAGGGVAEPLPEFPQDGEPETTPDEPGTDGAEEPLPDQPQPDQPQPDPDVEPSDPDVEPPDGES